MADQVQGAQTTSTAPADSGAGGLPQFDLAQWPGQMVWMLIVFAVLFTLFARVFVPKVGGAIAAREDRIAGDIGDARRLKDEAEATARAAAAEMDLTRAAAQKRVHEARAKARADAAAREAKEEAKIADLLHRSETVLAQTRDAAMSHVREIAQGAAADIVAKLTGAAATSDEVRAASPQA